MIRIGDLVSVTALARKDTYSDCDWAKEVLRVTHIATSVAQHPGYDESMNGLPLYDLETIKGEPVPCSLYKYEVHERR